MSYMFTRVKVGDYEAWKRNFEADPYGAREKALGYRICRGVEDPNEVFIQVQFPSVGDAKDARGKLLAGGLPDRFDEITGPTVAEEAEVLTAA